MIMTWPSPSEREVKKKLNAGPKKNCVEDPIESDDGEQNENEWRLCDIDEESDYGDFKGIILLIQSDYIIY